MTEDDIARLYEDYGYVLFRRCFAYLGNTVAAQDALQEVFVRALRGAGGFCGNASPRTWLARIADHLCIDLLRRQRRNPVQVLFGGDGDNCPADTLMAAMMRDDGDKVLLVRELMAALDPASQRLAMLHFMDELTQEEVARELGVSRRTVSERLRVLRSRARAILGTEEVSA